MPGFLTLRVPTTGAVDSSIDRNVRGGRRLRPDTTKRGAGPEPSVKGKRSVIVLRVDDHPAQILSFEHVGVPLVDLLELVSLGHQLVEFECAASIVIEQLGNLGPWPYPAEDGSLQTLLQKGQLEELSVTCESA